MATKSKRKSSVLDRDKRTVEFTPAQFLGAIVTLVCFGLVCFVLGIIVNRVDMARRASNVAQVQESAAQAQGEGIQRQASSTAVTPTESDEPKKEDVKKESYRTISVPEGPSQSRTQAVKEDKPKEEVQVAAADIEPPTKAVEPITPEKKPADTPKETAPVKPAAETAKAPATGAWTIQVAAYAANNRTRAESFIKDIEKGTGITPRLVASSDGKWIRVWIGEFGDKAEAEAMRKELASNPTLKDCIVKQVG